MKILRNLSIFVGVAAFIFGCGAENSGTDFNVVDGDGVVVGEFSAENTVGSETHLQIRFDQGDNAVTGSFDKTTGAFLGGRTPDGQYLNPAPTATGGALVYSADGTPTTRGFCHYDQTGCAGNCYLTKAPGTHLFRGPSNFYSGKRAEFVVASAVGIQSIFVPGIASCGNVALVNGEVGRCCPIAQVIASNAGYVINSATTYLLPSSTPTYPFKGPLSKKAK